MHVFLLDIDVTLGAKPAIKREIWSIKFGPNFQLNNAKELRNSPKLEISLNLLKTQLILQGSIFFCC